VKSKTTVKRDAYGITRFITDYKTSEPRRQEGKVLREIIPRVSQVEFNPPSDRPDPVEVIKEVSKGRLEHLIPIRYGRMSKNVFAFFRGSALTAITGLTRPGPGHRAA
jgi:hypothetical protein